MSETLLDARGLNCPLPVLKARKRLKAMAAGEALVVLTTDPKAPDDFKELCETLGHVLASIDASGDGHTIRLIKKEG